MISEAARRDNIPIVVEMLRPDITDTFWVNLIGRGYPSPNKWFRWCTERLKIKPMNNYILRHIKRNGEVLIVLGARKSESASRSQTMGKHEIGNFNLRRHGSIKGAFVYTPIEDFSENDVWNYLMSNLSPWGDDNASLRRMYQKNDDEEISFIIDDKSPPSGHSRFGCWTCTVVDVDKALISLIKDGHPEYKPLLDFRDYLKKIRDEEQYRDKYRKNQKTDKFIAEYKGGVAERAVRNGHEMMGPFTLETRHNLLKQLLEIQSTLKQSEPDVELISPEEIKAIELLWIYDGDPIESVEQVTKMNVNDVDTIDKLIDRLIIVENDMSDMSRRTGVFKKIEQVVYEYTMREMLKEGGKRDN
jgi:DNA sulfur modification protein DndC